jgi:hypothetical protein
LNGPIPDLIAPIRPLQLCADGGYQLRIRSLEGTPNYGPRQLWYSWCLCVKKGGLPFYSSRVGLYRGDLFPTGKSVIYCPD